MLIIGLTGGIASGKSTAASCFAKQGVPIIDTDQIARELEAPDQKALEAIVQHFGLSIVKKDGALNREALRQRIFSNPAERQWLEALLHPLIRERVMQDLHQLSENAKRTKQPVPYCIVLIPLLVETQGYDWLDRILVIDADEAIQRERLQKRDKIAEELAQAMLAAQARREARLAAAQDQIANNGDLQTLETAILKQHAYYLQLAEAKKQLKNSLSLLNWLLRKK